MSRQVRTSSLGSSDSLVQTHITFLRAARPSQDLVSLAVSVSSVPASSLGLFAKNVDDATLESIKTVNVRLEGFAGSGWKAQRDKFLNDNGFSDRSIHTLDDHKALAVVLGPGSWINVSLVDLARAHKLTCSRLAKPARMSRSSTRIGDLDP